MSSTFEPPFWHLDAGEWEPSAASEAKQQKVHQLIDVFLPPGFYLTGILLMMIVVLRLALRFRWLPPAMKAQWRMMG